MTKMDGKRFEKGDSVRLSCMVERSSVNWRFLWYRVVPLRDGLPEAPHWKSDARYSLDLVSDSRIEADSNYILNSAAPEHSGLYVCRAERGEPAFYTYSSPMLIWVNGARTCLTHLRHLIIFHLIHIFDLCFSKYASSD